MDLTVGEICYLRGFGLTSALGLKNNEESKKCLFFFSITGRFDVVRAPSKLILVLASFTIYASVLFNV